MPAGASADASAHAEINLDSQFKKVRALSCSNAQSIRATPFSDCEKIKGDLEKILVALKEKLETFGKEASQFSSQLEQGVDVDAGAQCAFGKLNALGLSRARALLNKNSHHLAICENYRNIFDEKKPSAEWIEIRNRMLHGFCAAQCMSNLKSSQTAHCAESCRTSNTELQALSQQVGEAWPEMKLGSPTHLRVKRAIREMRAVGEAAADISEQLKKTKDRSLQLIAKFKNREEELAKKYECVQTEREVREKAMAASAFLNERGGRSRGSAFYGQAVDEKGKIHHYLISAEHVAFGTKEFGAGDAKEIYAVPSAEAEKGGASAAREQQDQVKFQVKSGFYDKGSDAAAIELSRSGPALPIVDSARQPQVGDEFYSTGHPVSSGQDFVAARCTFAGYGDRLNDRGMAYYLDCPANAGNPASGASGGAVVDKFGTVWGINSAHLSDKANMILVVPVSADKNGKVQFGVTKPILSDDCWNESFTEKRRCQILPVDAP